VTTDVTSNSVIQRTDLIGSEIDSEMVFFNHNTGKYFGTGVVGADIWAYVESPKSISEICDYLVEIYDIDRDTCETQVQKFVKEMIAGGIVTSAASA